MAGEIIELSHLTGSPDALAIIRRSGADPEGSEMRAGGGRGKRNEITIGGASFTLSGRRLTVRWYETWGGTKSRELSRGDVDRVDIEADDRSAAGRQTWRVVVRLRDGTTFVPVRRRVDRNECGKQVERLSRE